MDHPFRSAAFGGFNRQDVLDYLEKMSADNAQRLQELQQRLEDTETERWRLTTQREQQEEELTILRRDRESLNQQLEQVKQELTDLQEREKSLTQELTFLRQERDQLKAKAAVLEPEATAYAVIKERTAGVELEAHCRAQNILDQANAQVQELHRNVEQWGRRVEQDYNALRSQVASTVASAAGKLDEAKGTLERLNTLMADQTAALKALTQSYRSKETPAKPEAKVILSKPKP